MSLNDQRTTTQSTLLPDKWAQLKINLSDQFDVTSLC